MPLLPEGLRRPDLDATAEAGCRDAVRGAQLERLAYTVEEAAALVGVGRDLLYDEIPTGRLRSKKAGCRPVMARHQLLEWLDGATREADRRAD
jgi:excisionase family DNA binding protein